MATGSSKGLVESTQTPFPAPSQPSINIPWSLLWCKQREGWPWLCAACLGRSTEGKRGAHPLLPGSLENSQPGSDPCPASAPQSEGRSRACSSSTFLRDARRGGSPETGREGLAVLSQLHGESKPWEASWMCRRAPVESGEGEQGTGEGVTGTAGLGQLCEEGEQEEARLG